MMPEAKIVNMAAPFVPIGNRQIVRRLRDFAGRCENTNEQSVLRFICNSACCGTPHMAGFRWPAPMASPRPS